MKHENREQTLQMRHAQLLAIFDAIPAIVDVVDPNTYELLYINKYAQELFGGNVAGRPCYQVFHGRTEPCPFCNNAELMADKDKTPRWEYHSYVLDRDLLATNAVIEWPDGRYVKFEHSIDITNRKRAEEERIAMAAQIQQGQKLEALGIFAGGVAHEVNNPINGIMNYAQLILDEEEPGSDVAKYATEIRAETERVAAVIENLLSFGQYGTKSYSEAHLNDLVHDTLSLVRGVMRHDMIAVNVDVPHDLPAIKCRYQQIQQVLMNLLTNARDALNEKYPGRDDDKRIAISARQVSATDSGQMPDTEPRPTTMIRLTVEDHGTGIPDDVRDRVFDPFFTTKPRDKGSGLGLSVSHGIVTEHHGKITIETKQGEYIRIHVDLPVDQGGSGNSIGEKHE